MIPEIEAIRARLEAATPGPWTKTKSNNPETRVCQVHSAQGAVCAPFWGPTRSLDEANRNAAFIAHAPEDIRALLDCVEGMSKALEFYADCGHFDYGGSPDFAPETVSDEPSNWKSGGDMGSEFTLEDGQVARTALSDARKILGSEQEGGAG